VVFLLAKAAGNSTARMCEASGLYGKATFRTYRQNGGQPFHTYNTILSTHPSIRSALGHGISMHDGLFLKGKDISTLILTLEP
jgi:hypothetical protein